MADAATSTPAHSCHRASQDRRPRAVSSQTSPAGASSAAVYLLSIASPAIAPASSQFAPAPLATSRARAASVSVQKNSSGVSGVIVTAPTPNSRVAFSSAAATMPVRRVPPRSTAARTSAMLPRAAASGASSRTPSEPSPASQVPSRIHSATIGG